MRKNSKYLQNFNVRKFRKCKYILWFPDKSLRVNGWYPGVNFNDAHIFLDPAIFTQSIISRCCHYHVFSKGVVVLGKKEISHNVQQVPHKDRVYSSQLNRQKTCRFCTASGTTLHTWTGMSVWSFKRKVFFEIQCSNICNAKSIAVNFAGLLM